MFVKHSGGETITIGVDDTTYQVHLPPYGYGYNHENARLEKTDIIIRSQDVSEQYWERTFDLDDYNHRRAQEKRVQERDPEYFDPDLQTIRIREWHRRLYGVWFMNNGKPIYLTGLHYFFLAHWPMDEGFADFRIPDMEKFYFTQYCIEDPQCFGEVELTKRRQGKTARAACTIFERVSRMRKVRGGIQSKTLEDAKDIFRLHLVDQFRKLPDFFIPEYDKAQGIAPKSELRFYRTNKRGKDAGEQGDELESFIDFRNSQKGAYDGSKQFYMIIDEASKDQEVDVWDRHLTVRKCLLDKNGSIFGKMICTTTVEDMGKFTDKFKTLWEKSDFNEKKNGKTGSWLYRWFTPAYRTKYFDKYGYPNEEQAKKDYESEWEAIADDQRAWLKAKRQDPFTWKDAFRADADNCIFNSLKLNERYDVLKWKNATYDRGDLEWVDDQKKEAYFSKNPNGRFYVAQEPISPNNVEFNGSSRIPRNLGRYVIGVDPYDHIKTKDGHFSNAAAAVYRKHDSSDEVFSDNFVCIYIGRPPHPYMVYEDIMKLCTWYGCQMLYEDNKPGIRHYFDDHHGQGFFLRNDKGEPGISGSTKTHIEIAEDTDAFINEHCHKVMFGRLIEDWLNFDLTETTRFDLSMAAGYALIAANRMRKRLVMLNQLSGRQTTDYFRTYSIAGKRSKQKTERVI